MDQPLNDDGNKIKRSRGERKAQRHKESIAKFNIKEKTEVRDGPLKTSQRRCSDVLCWLTFFAMVCTMAGLSIYGLKKGNVWKVIGGINSNLEICGASNATMDTKYLYLSDIRLDTSLSTSDGIKKIFSSGYCVSACPDANQEHIACSSSEQASCDALPPDTRYETVLVGPYCFPKDIKSLAPDQLSGWNNVIDKLRASNAGQFIMDMHNTQKSVYICLGLALVLSVLYIYMMSFAANCMAKCAILVIELCTIAGVAVIFYHYSSSDVAKKSYMIAGICLAVFWLLFNCMLWCYWTQLKVAIAVLDASAEFMASTKRMFFVSIYGWLLILITVLVWAAGIGCVVSLNQISAKGHDYPQIKNFVWEQQYIWMLIFMCAGIVWLIFFLSDTTSFIAMVSASTYYFSSNAEKNGSASVCMGFRLAYFEHAGTIAFGSLIHTIITIIRFFVEAICDQTERASENVLARILVCLARYLMRCLECCIEFVNRDAYAYCAITGDSYCKSAWNGFLLNLKYNARYTFAQLIAWLFICLGKIMICLINCGTYYLLIKYAFQTDGAVHNIWGPIIILAISTFITTQMFLGLFDEATLATLMSLAVDLDLNADRNDNQPRYGPPSFHKKMAKIFEFKEYKQITVTQEIQQHEVIATTNNTNANPGKRNEMV